MRSERLVRPCLDDDRLGPLGALLERLAHLREDPVPLLRPPNAPGRLGHGVHVGELGLLLILVEALVLVLNLY